MERLKAVFWDYPELTDPGALDQFLEEHGNDRDMQYWVLRRFLEYGRVVDVFQHFSVDTIAAHLGQIRLQPAAQKKWKRMIEVYGETSGK